MAEDQGKEEEKFDFTGEGEAVDYISLAQARLLAMQTAGEAPGNYGRRYQDVPMVFESVEDSENEDYYMVTLSFRPQGNFSGRPGQEQYFIEKEGTLAIRQVLSLPTGGPRFPVLPVAIGFVIVGIIVAVAAVFMLGGSGDEGGAVVVVAPTETLAPTDQPTPIAEPTAIPPDAIPTLTPIPAAAPTSMATPTTIPTATPRPTYTPFPTATPRPTYTPIPPTDTPTPVPIINTNTKRTLVFGRLDWDSVLVQNGVARYIVEHGYGYPTSQIEGSTLPLFQDLRKGDIDVLMEIWLPNQDAAWNEAIKAGEVFPAGKSLEDNWQSSFLIPGYLQDANPELDSIEDLKTDEFNSLFE